MNKIVIALIGAIASVGVAWITANATGKSAVDARIEEQQKTFASIARQVQEAQSTMSDLSKSMGTLEGPQKLCSAGLDSHWRDTIVVSQTWTREKCQQFANSIGIWPGAKPGDFFAVGCVSKTGYSWGEQNGNLPDDNSCNWR